MGAVIAAPRVAEPFWRPNAGLWRHGYTYSGHATAAAAALANLDVMERETLPKRALVLEQDLADALAPLAGHELVGEVRAGVGVLAAVQLSAGALDAEPGLPARLVAACRGQGILTRALGIGALQVSPALVLDRDELGELRDGLSAALDAV
jgi:adenosylmethionine-8-amino-7-oxononanoate aminotransferase